ncbi:PaaX family transcriptional regulator [Subtercola frigoramans]|uniref:Phenylacetic acid degradation operon negative regulatory protein n=1 Tax=Subtercola frigoramans TaxID=120298 RepID=A0ABS2L9C9_9MICO|nr:PaaX family transcriptional regulator C-terminal domain-containing protein [Subtercola frigoramans]MBM7473695.1 phenylacetic acid degradation operon negative regulatory protein [Subtercola frigoramans]
MSETTTPTQTISPATPPWSWKPRAVIFDLFGDYLRYTGQGVRLAHLTALLSLFSIEPATVRMNLSRLRREGWFTTTKDGRETIYWMTPKLVDLLDEGREKIFARTDESWDSRWTMVIYQVPESERAVREMLKKSLAWAGFGQLSPSTWVATHDRAQAANAISAQYPAARFDILWCEAMSEEQSLDLVRRCWDLDSLAEDYRAYIDEFGHLLVPSELATLDPPAALLARTHLTQSFRRFPFRDPQLPTVLEPVGWPGRTAFDTFERLHAALAEQAESCVSSFM